MMTCVEPFFYELWHLFRRLFSPQKRPHAILIQFSRLTRWTDLLLLNMDIFKIIINTKIIIKNVDTFYFGTHVYKIPSPALFGSKVCKCNTFQYIMNCSIELKRNKFNYITKLSNYFNWRLITNHRLNFD